MTRFEPLPRYRDRRSRRAEDGRPVRDLPLLRALALYHRIETEAAVLRSLMSRPPWVEHRGDETDENTGVRAAFRRWAPGSGPPTPEMERAVHERIREDSAFRTDLNEDEQDAGVARLAAVVHLVALGWRSDGPREAGSVGKACVGPEPKKKVLVSNTRFSRLLTAPPDPVLRVEALGRAFRQFKKAKLNVAPDDAKNLLRFLFSAEPEETVRRWANDYFRITTPGEPAEGSDEPEPAAAPEPTAA